MERRHLDHLHQRFGREALPEAIILDIPDDYRYMDPELVAELRLSVASYLSD
jgi:predicted protein tyrosine phosphatase